MLQLQLRTHDSHHLNFCRDLLWEPLTQQEWGRLRVWQESQAAQQPAGQPPLVLPSRRCAVCRGPVPPLRSLHSTTCGSRCAGALQKRNARSRRKAA